ncbi:MAG TPA: formylglycine-generating enzyme family protein, partial [SAR324 cluster bacterium]|nr:formylglycine-generating enzyme family protein [SAR324 cluster bacterium]
MNRPPLLKIKKMLALSLILLLLTVALVWASEKLFSRLVEEFYVPVIQDFISFVNKGERYPLIHTISELRLRVFKNKLGINKAEETKACSDRRNFGKEVSEEQKVFCSRYDELIDLARSQISISKVFEPLYLNYEPELLREIEKQKARDALRIWIRQKLNCLDDHFRCGRDERAMLKRVTGFDEETLASYR